MRSILKTLSILPLVHQSQALSIDTQDNWAHPESTQSLVQQSEAASATHMQSLLHSLTLTKNIKKKPAHMGFEEERQWKAKHKNDERIQAEAELIKNGGTVSPAKVITRKNQDQKVTVHLVPHSHDDMGWIKTVDEYYAGTKFDKDHSSVKTVLDTVIHELARDESRRFTYVEMGFFTKWWNTQPENIKETVKKLVKNKQLEIVNGGWSAHDEAAPQYEDIINNMMIGHQFLKKEFDITPTVGWNIDDFGHSDTNTRLFSEMGFDAMFFSRMDEDDKRQRKKDQAMTFLWRPGKENFGIQHQMLTYVWKWDYCYPPGLSVGENYQNDDPFESDKTLSTFNANEKMTDFVNYVQNETAYRKSQDVLIPMGCDFAWLNAQADYEQMTRIIEYINEHNTANLFLKLSTPSEYVDSVKKQNIKWPVRYEDIMPYGESPIDFWSGYFSSRPGLKKQIHDFQSMMNGQNKLFAQQVIKKDVTEDEVNKIIAAKESEQQELGVSLHHDGITGTEQQYVTEDYQERLGKALAQGDRQYKSELAQILKKKAGIDLNENLVQCVGFTNSTALDCPISDEAHKNQSEFLVVIHNTANIKNDQLSRIPLPHKNFGVQQWNGNMFVDVVSDIMEQAHFTNQYKPQTDYLMFVPLEIKANDVSILKLLNGKPNTQKLAETEKLSDSSTSLGIKGFSEDGEILFTYENKAQNLSQTFGMGLRFYQAHVSRKALTPEEIATYEDLPWNSTSNATVLPRRLSSLGPEGAYNLRAEYEGPNMTQQSHPYSILDSENVIFQNGHNLQQYTITFNNQSSDEQAIVTVRFSPQYLDELIEFEVEENSIQFDATKDVQDVTVGGGKDLTVNWRMYDGFDPKGQFWTDSNAMGMIQRKLNHRDGWKASSPYSPISSNYYPVTSGIAMRDQNGSNIQITVMNDRAQGGSADLNKATIELMQNRRLSGDDVKGVLQALNEVDKAGRGIKVTAKYLVQIFDYTKGKTKQREQQILGEQPMEQMFAFNYSMINNQFKSNATSLSSVEFMNTTEDQITYHALPLKKNKILVRFVNLADRFDISSQETKYIDVIKFAETFYKQANPGLSENPMVKIEEYSLTYNQLQSELDAKREQFQWVGEGDEKLNKGSLIQKPADKGLLSQLALEPQRIRTFEIIYNVQSDLTSSDVAQTILSKEDASASEKEENDKQDSKKTAMSEQE